VTTNAGWKRLQLDPKRAELIRQKVLRDQARALAQARPDASGIKGKRRGTAQIEGRPATNEVKS
jgi:hypothetical protein